jgi:uncharacterized delta-60 repeat protein
MRTLLFLILILSVFQSMNAVCQDLDLTFNTTGKVQLSIGSGNDDCKSMVIDNNGKIVLAGYTLVGTNYQFSVNRLNTSGALDVTFNTDGKLIIPLPASGGSGQSLKLQSDNKIVVAGYYSNKTKTDFAVMRLNTDGSLDATFNATGIDTISVALNGGALVTAMDIQNFDGKIVVVGNSSDSLAIIRLNTDGTLDAAFGINGKAYASGFDANAVLVQSDGKIFVAGVYNTYMSVMRLNSNGSVDNTYGTNGVVSIDLGTINQYAKTIVKLKSGKIVIAGTDGNDFIAIRLNSDGTLDNTFNSNGKININFLSTDVCFSVAEDTTTKDILLAGYAYSSTQGESNFAICRLSSVGVIEAQAIIPIGSNSSEATSIAIQSNEKIVVAGTTDIGTGNEDFAVIRLLTGFVTTSLLSADNISANLNLFPNPATQNITINSTYNIEQIRVVDVIGNEVMNISSSGNTQVNISTLPKGLYNFVITTDKGIGNKKVSVQ